MMPTPMLKKSGIIQLQCTNFPKKASESSVDSEYSDDSNDSDDSDNSKTSNNSNMITTKQNKHLFYCQQHAMSGKK
jgi:hypothetical protein